MAVDIREGDIGAFFAAPFAAYGATSPYVSPLKGDLARFVDKRQNPLFSDADSDITFFTAHRGGGVIGRVTAHVHGASNRVHGVSRGYFGYFDVADDAEAAGTLLARVEAFHRAKGLAEVWGNFNLTAMQQIGVMTGGVRSRALYRSGLGAAVVAGAAGGQRVRGDVRDDDFRGGPDDRAVACDRRKKPSHSTRSGLRLCADHAGHDLAADGGGAADPERVIREEPDVRAGDGRGIPLSGQGHEVDHGPADQRGPALAWAACGLHHLHPGPEPVPEGDREPVQMVDALAFPAPSHDQPSGGVDLFRGDPRIAGGGVNPVVLHRVAAAAKAAGYERLGNTWIADVNAPSLAQKEKAAAEPMHRLHLYHKAL